MLFPFVLETANNPGTGAFSLLGAPTGRQTLIAAAGAGGTLYYGADNGTSWEEGYGVVTAGSPPTLSRTVIRSSAGVGVAASFSGVVDIYCTLPASRALFLNSSGVVDGLGGDLRGLSGVFGGPVSGNRNEVVNGCMDFWQDRTLFNPPASGSETADGWVLSYDGSGSVFNVTRQPAADAALMSSGIKYFWRYVRTTPGTGGTYLQLITRMERAHTLAGKTVTLGFWGTSNATRVITALLTQNFGTGGSPSALVNSSAVAKTLTTSWQWFTAGFTLAGIDSKTLGTNDDDFLQLTFNFPLNVNETISITGVRLQEGTDIPANMAERRNLAAELAMVQRYRCPVPLFVTGSAVNTTTALLCGQTPVPMRATPSVTWASATGTLSVPGGSTFNTTTAPTVAGYDTKTGGLALSMSGFTGLTAQAPGYLSAITGASARAFLSAKL